MFKLVIEVCFKNYFGSIHAIVLPLESTKSVYFFGTPGISIPRKSWTKNLEYTISANSLALEIIRNSIWNFRSQMRIYHQNLSLTMSFHVASGRRVNLMVV